MTNPVHRHWLAGRLRNRWPAATPPEPPAAALPAPETPELHPFADLPPAAAAEIRLPGEPPATVTKETAGAFVARPFAAPAAAALHAFSWLDDDGAALAVLWDAWLQRHGAANPRSPAWQPAVLAERTVALVDLARRRGLPGPRGAALQALAAHAEALLGEPAPSPYDVARQGWALARLGLDCAMPETTGRGLARLIADNPSLILPSGMTVVESTHHHLALCRYYADAWLAARRHGRGEAGALEAILRRLLGVVPLLSLPGGLPLVGDVVETLPPGWLSGLVRGASLDQGWTGRLSADEQAALAVLRDGTLQDDLEALRADGWLRVDAGGWSGLWHAPAGGWTSETQYGHQDLSAAELHYGTVPVFVDAGGSRLGEINGAAGCGLAATHGGLELNGEALFPANRPGYSEEFRRDFAGAPPLLSARFDGAGLIFVGQARRHGLREGERRWSFADGVVTLDDRLNGTGRFLVTRRFLTPFIILPEDDRTVRLESPGLRFRLIADHPLRIGQSLRWTGYGQSQPLQVIEVTAQVNLPWRGRIRVEPA